MDHLLAAEALLHRASRTGLDYWIKGELVDAVDHADRVGVKGTGLVVDDEATGRLEARLYPLAARDDHCYAAERMLCEALALHGRDLGYVHAFYGLGSTDGDALVDRRVVLFHYLVNAHAYGLHDDQGWPVLSRCTTGDRVVVLGLTAMMLHRAVSGDLVDLSDVAGDLW